MKKLGLVLAGLGAFLLVLAVMLKVYVYPQLAVAPADQNSVTVLTGPDATIFDTATLTEITTDLTTQVVTVGDVSAAEEEGNGVVVWLSKTSTKDSDGVVRSRDVELAAFDEYTAEAVNCCGEFISEEEGVEDPVEHQGLTSKFPFDTQQETYDFWDSTLREAVPIAYVDTDEIDGVTVYRFEQTIPPTEFATIDLPADLLGEEGDETLTAQRMYSNTRTLWVEPNTGVIIDREEQQKSTIAYDGTDRITATEVVTSYDDATVTGNADKYGSLATQLNLVKNVLPLVFLILGVALIIVGFVLTRRGALAKADGAHAKEPATV